MKDNKYWKLDAKNCAFDAKDGAQTVTMMRTNAGLSKIKAGGAIYGDLIYTDASGSMNQETYLGFANDPDTEDKSGDKDGEDSAFAMTATAALAVAAAALF